MKTRLQDLQSVEDFFDFYQIPYNSNVVTVRRFHILKRFRDYLQRERLLGADPADSQVWEKQRSFLLKSYHDLLHFPPEPGERESMGRRRTSACSGCGLNCLRK